MSLECLCDLTRHQKAVNIVRWSPDGKLLASGDDESVIIVWQLKPGDSGCGGGLFDDDHENKENWVVYKMIRSHLDDVYDLSWSGCGQFLLSGSVDNAAIITNVHKNNKVKLSLEMLSISALPPFVVDGRGTEFMSEKLSTTTVILFNCNKTCQKGKHFHDSLCFRLPISRTVEATSKV